MSTKEKIPKKLLWILFGFIIISIGQSCIETFIYTYSYYGFNNDFLEIHFKYYVPAFSAVVLLITSFATIYFLKKMLTKSLKVDLKFPTSALILLTVFSICISFFPKFIFDEQFEQLYSDYSKFNYLSDLDIDLVFKSIETSIFVSTWMIVLLILSYCGYLINKRSKNA